jgi:hypothetical protein
MDWREYVRRQLPDITGDAARDDEIVEEIAQHLAARCDEIRGSGATEPEARARAAGELHSSAQVARALRRADRERPTAPVPPVASSARLLSDLWNDTRYALRLLRRTPAFTIAALLTLALGIGMTTAIFSIVQAVLLRPVPIPESDRLVVMWETDRNSATTREPASFPDFMDYRRISRQVDRVGAFSSMDVNLVPDRGDPRRLSALAVTADMVQLLGVRTIAGRSFAAEEERPNGPPVAMISDGSRTAIRVRASMSGCRCSRIPPPSRAAAITRS